MVRVNEKYEIKKDGVSAFIVVEEMEITVKGITSEFTKVTVIGRNFKTRTFEDNENQKLHKYLIEMQVRLGI